MMVHYLIMAQYDSFIIVIEVIIVPLEDQDHTMLRFHLLLIIVLFPHPWKQLCPVIKRANVFMINNVAIEKDVTVMQMVFVVPATRL